jgi:CheY-like chemotaxis protein/signal transduction histidine kinase
MLNPILNRMMDLFISEQNDQADMDTKSKSLLLNLSSMTFTLVVLVEGIWSLIDERAELAIPFLTLGFILTINHLSIKSLISTLRLNIFLAILFVTCCFFVLLGGNTGVGIIWVMIFPFFAIALTGRQNGLRWAMALALALALDFLLLKDLSIFFVNYGTNQSTYYFIMYLVFTLAAFAFQFIRSEVLLEKERIILDTQNRNKAQEDLLSKLSHQIRTPLSNITGILDILESTRLNDEQKDAVNTIHASANNLVSVVNNLVMASSLTMKESNDISNFNLYNTLNNVLRLFPYENYRVRLSLSLAADIPSQLTGNSIKIKQILLNLINSIVTRPTGSEPRSITIEVKKAQAMPDMVELIFRIISDFVYKPDSDSHANESFYNYQDLHRLNAGKVINFLDLAITQKMIESDGHTLNIITNPKYTIFEFNATFASAAGRFTVSSDSYDKRAENRFKNRVELSDASILLVEDNFSNQQIICLYLKNEVKSIDIAFNGKEAIDKFGTAKYDLILMDVQMPIMDGFKATQKIRELERTTNTRVPIIAVTANAFPEDKERCLAVGMDDYISKPFQPEDLLKKIKQFLNN